MRFLSRLAVLLVLFACALPSASQSSLDLISEMVPLSQGEGPEWEAFAGLEPDSILVISFEAHANETDFTLELTQSDVRRDWRIGLNDVDLGPLQANELLMTVYRDVPAGALEDGTNVLRIRPAGAELDDIRIGRIVLHDAPQEDLLTAARATVRVRSADTNVPLPARVTIVDEYGALQSIGATTDIAVHEAVRPGSIYTGDGVAEFGLPVGRFTVYASRGFEYGADSVTVDLQNGEDVQFDLQLHREVATEGWVAMDTHVHTFTHSGHGDAGADERILSLAGEGIEVPVITEHNMNVDLGPMVASMGHSDHVVPIVGNEYTTPVGHFNIFPVGVDASPPTPQVASWEGVGSELDAIGPPKGVILNHARDLHSDFRPFGPRNYLSPVGRTRDGSSLPANAMEVINSSAQQADVMQLVEDWFGALNGGLFLTPVGSSDSHDVARYLVGQGRTYVRSEADAPADVDLDAVVERFRSGEVVASFGLMPVISVDGSFGPGQLVPGRDAVDIAAHVLAPSWLDAEHVTVYMNGYEIRSASIFPNGEGGQKWLGTWSVDLPPHDVFLSIVALGPGKTPPFWPIPKPYQRESTVWTPRVIGVTGAVWIDVDGDGEPTSARTYATGLVDQAGGDVTVLVRLLTGYDESIAAQAAAELHARGLLSSDVDVESLADEASPSVRRGFRAFMDALGE